MVPNKLLPLAFVVFFSLLAIILLPSFSNLGDILGYAVKEEYKGIALMTFLKAELIIIVTVWGILLTFKEPQEIVDGDAHVKRHLVLIVFIVGQVFMGFFAGGILVHQDASWYQVLHDSAEVMPSQAVILLICYPLYLFFGGGAYLYARTRLFRFTRNKAIPFLVLTFAPFSFLPYYDASMLMVNRDVADLAYVLVYWLLSVSWVAIGVGYILFKSSQEILKGLSDPFEEM